MSKSQPKGKQRRIRKGDKAWVEIEGLKVTISYNEKHSVILGAVLGVAMTYRPDLFFLPVAFAFLGYPALKGKVVDEPTKTMALRTILHEPWWFLVPYVVLFRAASMI